MKNCFSLELAPYCPINEPYKRQYLLVAALLEQQRAAHASNPGAYEQFHNLSASELSDDLYKDHFRHLQDFVISIEQRANQIVAERDKLPELKRLVMIKKIRQVAYLSRSLDSSRPTPLADRAIADFASFDAWRLQCLDGVDMRILYMLEYRGYTGPKKGKEVRLFDALFSNWADVAGVDAMASATSIVQSVAYATAFDGYMFGESYRSAGPANQGVSSGPRANI